MCKIMTDLKKRKFKVTSKGLIPTQDIRTAIKEIGSILEQNDSPVVSSTHKRRINSIVSSVYN